MPSLHILNDTADIRMHRAIRPGQADHGLADGRRVGLVGRVNSTELAPVRPEPGVFGRVGVGRVLGRKYKNHQEKVWLSEK